MTRLAMHWHMVQGADGRKHLDLAWEAAHNCVMASYSRPQSRPGARHKQSRGRQIRALTAAG